MPETGSGVRRRLPSAGPRLVRTHSRPANHALMPENPHRLRLPQKNDRILLCEFELVFERGRLLRTPAIDEIDDFRAEPPRGRDHIDGGIAGANAGYSPANFDLRERLDFRFLDELHRAVNALQILARQLEFPGLAQSHADEDAVELFLEIREGDIASDLHLLPELHTQIADHLNFANRIGRARLVGGYAVCAQAAGKFVSVENRNLVAPLRQFRRASQGCGPRADAGHTLAVWSAGPKELYLPIANVIDGVALQAANFNGRLSFFVHHAGAFAEHFSGAHAAAAFAQDIGGKDHAS